MTVNSVFNVILPFNNCDSIPPLQLRSQGINPVLPCLPRTNLPSESHSGARRSCWPLLRLGLISEWSDGGRVWGRRLPHVIHLPPLLQLILTRGLGALGVLHISDVSSSWDDIKRCVSGPVCVYMCVCQGWHLYISSIPNLPAWENALSMLSIFHFSWHFEHFENHIWGNTIHATHPWVCCACVLRWNGFFPHHLTQQQRSTFLAPCRVMISISNRLPVLFFCGSFRGDWMVAQWPWTWMGAPKWYSNMRQHLTSGLTLISNAGEVYYLQLSTDLLFLSSLFLQRKVLFLYVWWLVSSLWGHCGGSWRELRSNTVARNYCKHYSQRSSHSEGNSTSGGHISQEDRGEGEAKSQPKCNFVAS